MSPHSTSSNLDADQMRSRSSRRLTLTAPAVRVLTTLASGSAYSLGAAIQEPEIKASTSPSARQIPNVEIVNQQQIRNYYGDPLGTGTIGGDSHDRLDISSISDGEHWLDRSHHARLGRANAVVLDIDDTVACGVLDDRSRYVEHASSTRGGWSAEQVRQ